MRYTVELLSRQDLLKKGRFYLVSSFISTLFMACELEPLLLCRFFLLFLDALKRKDTFFACTVLVQDVEAPLVVSTSLEDRSNKNHDCPALVGTKKVRGKNVT